jgi:hypothetical protein
MDEGGPISDIGKIVIDQVSEKIKEANTPEEKRKWFEVLEGKRSFKIGGRNYKAVSL